MKGTEPEALFVMIHMYGDPNFRLNACVFLELQSFGTVRFIVFQAYHVCIIMRHWVEPEKISHWSHEWLINKHPSVQIVTLYVRETPFLYGNHFDSKEVTSSYKLEIQERELKTTYET